MEDLMLGIRPPLFGAYRRFCALPSPGRARLELTRER
jgi:hypothetical protein